MRFKALKEMAQTITRYKIAHIEVLGNPGQHQGQVEKLYDGLLSGAFSSDEEAGRALFGTDNFDQNQYRRVKNKLERRLINTAIFVDTNRPIFDERSKAYCQCNADFASANILIMRGAKFAGIELLERTLEFIQKYEFINLGAEITRILREQYGQTQSNATKHTYYSILHQQFEEKRRLEMLAINHHEQLIHYYIERRTPNIEIHQKAAIFFEKLLPLMSQADTVYFCYNTYQVGMIKHFAANDCVQALQLCEVGIQDLFRRKNTNGGAKVGLLAQKMLCLIQLKIFDLNIAEDTMNAYWTYALEGSFNWFRGHELQLFYCLHTRQYAKALASFTEGYQHPRFESIEGTVRENWHLYGGYLHLLADLGQLDKKLVEQVVGAFRYSKFINDIGILGREKEGMNIPLVNLPILISLAKSEPDFPEEYLSSLERYRKRYLKDDLNTRSACFVKLLLLLARKPFEGKNIGKKIKQELQVLRQEKTLLSRQTIAVEIIPYEDLWWLLTGEKV